MAVNAHSTSTSTSDVRRSGSRAPTTRNHAHGDRLRRWNRRTMGSTPASYVTNVWPGADDASRLMA